MEVVTRSILAPFVRRLWWFRRFIYFLFVGINMDDDFSPVLEEEVMMVEEVVDDDGIDMYILYELCIYTVYRNHI